MALSPGQVLNNRYRIVKLLGQGGFGAVYQAWDVNLEAYRAVKENLDTSLEAQRQFKLEAQILDKLSHPNLPRVIDHFIIPEQGQYLVMDFVDGEDLAEMLRRVGGPLPETQVLEWVSQVCDALSYLHSRNPPIIHRDIKPANIKIRPNGQAMLVDFGIAKVFDPNLKTTVGAQAYTPGYSPPEQYGIGSTDARSDVYALGATLYHLLSGQSPPASVDIMSGVVPALAPLQHFNPLVSPRVNAAVERAMQLNRSGRFGSAADFKAALASHPSPPTLNHKLWRWIGAGIVLVVGIIVAGALLVGGLLGTNGGNAYDTVTTQALVDEVATNTVEKQATQTSQEIIPSSFTPTGESLSIKPDPTRSQTPHLIPTPSGLPQRITDSQGGEMALIPAGEFQMGSESGDSDERPVHTVYLDDFYIDVYEVTNALYRQCVDSGACSQPQQLSSKTHTSYYNAPSFSQYPVIWVDWHQANSLCQWRGARLPTEAEWEKAARGTNNRIYPWGNANPNCELANLKGCTGDTMAVGSHPAGASSYGIMDMAGNVWEWISDWYQSDYYSISPSENPQGPTFGDERVWRGGSWLAIDSYMMTAFRSSARPDYSRESVGFRCARSP